MTKDNKGFRPMSEENDNDMMPLAGKKPNSGMMPESMMKQKENMMPKSGMMPEEGKMPNSGMMPESMLKQKENMMPKSGMMPEEGKMPNSGMMTSHQAMPNNMNVQGSAANYKALYPEVFYKVQPYVMMVCDELENMGEVTPTQEMMDNIADNIYEDIKDMYPEMSDYIEQSEESQQTVVLGYGGRFGRPFRRRGMFRDLIGILLLGELFGRRRRRY